MANINTLCLTSSFPENRQSWSLIFFGHNESHTVAELVDRGQAVLERISSESSEIICVDDGSTDGSAFELENLSRRYKNIKVIRHEQRKGIGAALRSGYEIVQYENCCAIPADGQFAPEELLGFHRILPRTFVSFYRTKKTGYSVFRLALSEFHRRSNQLFLGMKLRDVNWVKIYKTEDLRVLRLSLRSVLIETEICAKLISKGCRVVEAPSIQHPRRFGTSHTSSPQILLGALWEVPVLLRHLGRRPAQFSEL